MFQLILSPIVANSCLKSKFVNNVILPLLVLIRIKEVLKYQEYLRAARSLFVRRNSEIQTHAFLPTLSALL